MTTDVRGDPMGTGRLAMILLHGRDLLAWLLRRDGVPALLVERSDDASLGRLPKAGAS
ncbi:hypothetical protein [Pseudonocardia sp. KRD291]|uniref:hypothetical protein n=1 Tax=Pseudonocardia sp. KRD291 TaxID=2792007 RepID=UPI001C4A5740|nr:hypothetical protein [Pseudonocardia sp. KRD291]MBW0104439.1 hypothetical protein [Pseudonocardia sp. KRD291]